MGLDWVLERHPPKRGKEKQFKAAKARLDELDEAEAPQAELDAARAALAAVSHTPMEELGAPRVGIDARATKWFLEKVYADEVERAKA